MSKVDHTRGGWICGLAASLIAFPSLGHAHGGHAPSPATIARWWTFDPWLIAGLLASALLFVRGERALRRRAAQARPRAKLELAAFFASWLTLVIALLSPVDRLSDALFSVHMFQHELLMLLAAPLLVLARPLQIYLWALPQPARARVLGLVRARWVDRTFHFFVGPWVALLVHGFVRWIWHVPALFEAALESEWVHGVQHALFFATALAFWWSVVHGGYGKVGYGVSVLFVFATSMHTGALGALITLADHAWYPLYGDRARLFELTAVDDQQLAGLVMWVGSGVLLTLIGLALFAAWLGESRQRAARSRFENAVRSLTAREEPRP